MKLSRFNIFLILTLSYAALIFYLSSISDLRLPRDGIYLLDNLMHIVLHSDYAFLFAPLFPLIKQQDKLLHILLYSGFGLVLFGTLRYNGKSIAMAGLLTIFLGTLYGVSDELHQMFVPGRSTSIMDIVADITGILFALTLIFIFNSIRSIFIYLFRRFEIEKRI